MVCIVIASGSPPLARGVGVKRQVMHGGRVAAHIEFENARNHNAGLRPISIFEHCELEGFGAINEKSAAVALFFLDNPVAPAVLADQEERRSRTRLYRGRLSS